MKNKRKRRYSDEYKKEVIEYSMTSHKSIQQISKEFDISMSTFYKWKQEVLGLKVNQRAVGSADKLQGSQQSPLEMADEIRRLTKELAKAHRREEILKKAALILGEDPHNNMS